MASATASRTKKKGFFAKVKSGIFLWGGIAFGMFLATIAVYNLTAKAPVIGQTPAAPATQAVVQAPTPAPQQQVATATPPASTAPAAPVVQAPAPAEPFPAPRGTLKDKPGEKITASTPGSFLCDGRSGTPVTQGPTVRGVPTSPDVEQRFLSYCRNH